MNHANIERSVRLQRVLEVLHDGEWHSTLDIINEANVCAVNSAVSELRSNGYKIDCIREGNAWYYILRESDHEKS